MIDRAPTLRDALTRGVPLLGILVRMPAQLPIDIAALVDMDVVLIDCEHGAADDLALHDHIHAARQAGLHVLVRMRPDEDRVLRVLDAGASAIVAPHIDTAAEARRLVQAVRYPPEGRRGFATYTSVGGHGLGDAVDHAERMNRGVAAVAMIESLDGLDAVESITAVVGLDAIMVGPADLTHDATAHGHERVAAARIAADAMRSSAQGAFPSVAIVGSRDTATEALEAGHAIVLYNYAAVIGSTLKDLSQVRPTS
jgi:4-hydroxy-2-oxoheptanedioate aldolase